MLALLLAVQLAGATDLHRIVVSSDQWHSTVAFPTENGFEEWGFASRIWYLEHQRGPLPLVETLLWPEGPGVIERIRGRPLLYERSTQQPAFAWEFDITTAELAALVRYVHESAEDTVLLEEPGRTVFTATHPYNVLHTCHHWLAGALRAAGIPMRPFLCMVPEGLWLELNRVRARCPRMPPGGRCRF